MPSACAIILEEDLEVSPGCTIAALLEYDTCHYHSYFSQTVGLMDKDDSIYCISAWNDLVCV